MQRIPAAGLLHHCRRTLARYAMLVPGDRVLVALSGGPDSVALLAALAALSDERAIELRAAHLNHGLRGAESFRDQRCAETVAARLGVRCIVAAADGLEHGANLEARARAQRYAFLARVAAAEGCTKIATGHTLDDQAETVLMRILRGSGADGLAGIRPVRDGRIIRPLIACTRTEVLTFLRACGLTFCEDSSNLDARFLRNRIRREVLPLLESITPAAKRQLAAAAQRLGEEAAWLDAQARRTLVAAGKADGALSVAALAEAPAPLRPRVVRAWLRGQRGDLQRLSAAHFDAVLKLIQRARPNAQVRLPGGHVVLREYDVLRFAARVPQSAAEPEQMLAPGSTVCLASGWHISAERVAAGAWRPAADLWEVVADADAIGAALVVRCARPGDRIQPLGLGGHRKLQDIFVDRKLPLRCRRARPLVACAGEVFWVPGVVRSNRALVTPATRSALRLIARAPGIAGRNSLCYT